MGWRDNLRPASFRGVPFFVESVSTEVGRRNRLYEYPFKDEPFLEDLGKSAGIYNVVGYVIQSADNDFDYFSDRDALIAALETAGAGTFVHPFFGSMEAALIGKARIDEQMSSGAGVARFQMVFAKVGTLATTPSGKVDYEAEVTNAVDDQYTSIMAAFQTRYQAFSAGLTQATSDVQVAINMVRETMYIIQATPVSIISQMQTALASVYDTVEDVVDVPADLAEALKNTLDTYRDLSDNAPNSTLISAALEVTKFGEQRSSSDASMYGGTLDDLVDAGTENSDNKIANREAIVLFMRVGALMEAALVSMQIEYKSYEQAFAAMQKLVAAIDDVLEYIDTGDDELYSSLQEFKPLVVAGMLDKGASLPLIVDYEVPAEVTPSLVIAHDLYEDLSREQEVIERNGLDMLHPGFPPSGDTLEVLNE